jgi:hypothetical protein
MTHQQNEAFIRSHIRRILLQEKEEEKQEKPKEKSKSSSGKGSKVLGGPSGGTYSKELRDIFTADGGSAAKANRLAVTDPQRLVKNLNISRPRGDDDKEKVENLLQDALTSTDAMKAAFGGLSNQEDGQGRWGYLVKNETLTNDRDATLFVFDTLRGAVNAGLLELDNAVRVTESSGGALVYTVESKSARWNQAK